MTPNETPSPEQFPAPIPPEPPGPPPESWLQIMLRHRFLLVSLVVLLFLVAIFSWESWRRPPGPSGELEHPVAVAPHEIISPPPGTPQPEGEEKSLMEVPTKPELKGEAKEPAHPAVPPKEAPAVIPPAAPSLAAPAREPVKGEVFTQALIKIMDEQVNQTWFGWRPNTILFGKLGLTDNVNNIQLGVLEVARRTVVVLNENMTRFATTEAYNPRVNEAMNYFMVSPDKYWFPSASGKYREAMQDLNLYIENLKVGRAHYYSRVDYLIALLSNYKDILGSSYHNLIKDTEADGKNVSWWVVDDYFYFSRGIALGMSQMLEAVKEEFHQELQKKNSQKLLEDAIHALHTASQLAPWMVFNGGKAGILANHRADMSTYIGEAEHVISTMQMQLATN